MFIMEQLSEKEHVNHDFDLNSLPANHDFDLNSLPAKEHENFDFDLNSLPASDYPSSQISGGKESSDIDKNSSLPSLPDNPSPQKSVEKESSNIDENSSEKPPDHNESSEKHGDSQAQNDDNHSGNYATQASPQYYHRYGQHYDSFERTYNCFSMSAIEKSHLDRGNQIIMPASAFELLLNTRVEYPMLFEIRNELKERVSHCGVYEFTAQEGSVFLPDWMMENLQLQNGNAVSLKNTTLEKGTFIKLQPHSMDFLSILNPKAALEETLSANLFCLTTGDTIKVNYNNREFRVNIVETRPSNAICIIDTDCEVDFVLPLDYKKPEQPVQLTKEKPSKEGQKFVPFTGLSRRLDEKHAAELALADSGSVKEENQTINAVPSMVTESEIGGRKRPAKVVFGYATHGKKSKEVKTEEFKAETPEKEQCQPFRGNKYSLEG